MPLINFSGLASGIDSEALIDATREAREAQRVTPKQEKIDELEDTNSALSELKTKLTELKSLAENFTTLNGGAVAKQALSADETVVSASASNSATNGSYTLSVTQLAENATYSFASGSGGGEMGTYTAASDAIVPDMDNAAAAADRTVTVDVGTAPEESISIVLTSTTTLDEFVTEYNESATESSAALVNVGSDSSPDYKVVITTNNTGTEEGSISVTIGSEITNPSLGSSRDAWTNNSVDNAADASFSIDGVGTITRPTNTVSDLITGVTFNLVSTGSSVTVQIEDDVATTTTTMQDYVEKHNEIVEFINENNLVSREEDGEEVTNIFGPLSKTRVDDGALTAVRSDISSSTYSGGSSVRIFADLGIATERDGTLAFDTDDFQTALADEPESVRNILQNFGDEVASTSGTIDQYIRFNGLLDLTINGNNDLITDLNDQIARAEQYIAREAENIRLRFARLESLVGQLQNQQSALSSALAGLQSA